MRYGSKYLTVVAVSISLLLLSCTVWRSTGSIGTRENAKELVQKAKDGDKDSLAEIIELVTSRARGRGRVYDEIRTNPDTLFIPVLDTAYEADLKYRRHINRAMASHYFLRRNLVLSYFENWLKSASDSLEQKWLSENLVRMLRDADEIENVFPLHDKISSMEVRDAIMKSLASRVGNGYYKKTLPSYCESARFPPCKLNNLEFTNPELARIALKDTLMDEDIDSLSENLRNLGGIYWTVLGLLRVKEPQVDDFLLKWAESKSLELSWYKALILLKKKGAKVAFDLFDRMIMDSPEACKKCMWVIRDLVQFMHTEDGTPKNVQSLAQWIVQKAIVDSIELPDLLGEPKKIRIPDLGCVARSDTADILVENIDSLRPIEVSGRQFILSRDKAHFSKSTTYNWGLRISLKWYENWVLVTLAWVPPEFIVISENRFALGRTLGGGLQEFLLREVNGEWRLVGRLYGAMS